MCLVPVSIVASGREGNNYQKPGFIINSNSDFLSTQQIMI